MKQRMEQSKRDQEAKVTATTLQSIMHDIVQVKFTLIISWTACMASYDLFSQLEVVMFVIIILVASTEEKV